MAKVVFAFTRILEMEESSVLSSYRNYYIESSLPSRFKREFSTLCPAMAVFWTVSFLLISCFTVGNAESSVRDGEKAVCDFENYG